MEPPKRMHNLKRVVFVIASIFAIMMIVLVALFIYMSNNSSQGVISKPRLQGVNPAQKKPLTLKAQNFSLSYPTTYANVTTQQRDINAIEQYQFTAGTIYDKRLAITVVKIPEGIGENSAYKFRKLYADQYIESSIKVDDGNAFVMAKNDKSEQALFIPKGNRMTILVLVTDGSEDLMPEIDSIAKSFKWAQ